MYPQLERPPNIILVIDDHTENIKFVVETLHASDYLTVVARSGEEGLRRAQFAHPDLILLDVQMPGLDGFETCRQLKEDLATQHIPVIFMTVADSVADKVRGFESGAVDYVTKPIQVVELLARIRTHISLSALRQELAVHNAQLAVRVQERTAALEAEVERRKQREREHLHLLEVLQNQSEQLRVFSHNLSQQYDTQQEEVIQLLQKQVCDALERLETKLERLQTLYTQPEVDGQSAAKITLYLEDVLVLLKASKTWFQQLQQCFVSSSATANDDLLSDLSPREREVMHLLIAGNSSPEIADLLNLSVHTVRTYRRRLMKKIKVDNISALTKLAIGGSL